MNNPQPKNNRYDIFGLRNSNSNDSQIRRLVKGQNFYGKILKNWYIYVIDINILTWCFESSSGISFSPIHSRILMTSMAHFGLAAATDCFSSISVLTALVGSRLKYLVSSPALRSLSHWLPLFNQFSIFSSDCFQAPLMAYQWRSIMIPAQYCRLTWTYWWWNWHWCWIEILRYLSSSFWTGCSIILFPSFSKC